MSFIIILRFVRYSLAMLIALTFISVNAGAQQFHSTPNGVIYIKKKGDPDVTPQTLAKYHTSQTTAAQTGTQRYIVRFKSSPVFKKGNGSLASRVRDAEAPHRQFEADLIRATSKVARSSADPVITHHFTKVFNGVALTASQEHAAEIRTLSYVDAVMEDRIVTKTDDQTNAIIGADKLWSQFSTMGEGATIGIIDTGIDYNHEALGQGFGPGFKVIGGYDFVNNDSDPMDDHGHGTHVAGIAAANGSFLKGVAPGALLVAYKVLDATGTGFDSNVISAIERAADPDQNSATNDQLDILSMSLGHSAYPVGFDDPLVDAVENAIGKGITICIAAGNSGSNPNAIATPGIAPHAITVGATDSTDVIAYFSSVGPTADFHLKPDVVAPGVAVNSALLGGGYIRYDGTSMATPHVAGSAALLKSLHPDWTPEIIKGVLMATAKELNVSIWAEGKGRIDVLKAAQSRFVVTPGSVSIGQVDLSQPVWSQTFTFTLTNLTHQPISISLALTGDFLLPAVTANLASSVISLAGDETKNIVLPVSINTAALPQINAGGSYDAKLVASSGAQTETVPVIFVNYAFTQFHFATQQPDLLLIFGSDSLSYGYGLFVNSPVDNLRLPLPQGTFDMVAFYGSIRQAVKEDVTPSASPIVFDPAEANHRLVFSAVDEHNKTIHGKYEYTFLKKTVRKNGEYGTYFPTEQDTLYLSTISYGLTALLKLNSFVTPEKDRFYDAEALKTGSITADSYVTNDPAGYQQINYTFVKDASPIYLNYNVPPSPGLADTTKKDFQFFMMERDRNSTLYQTYFSLLRNGVSWQTAPVSSFIRDSLSFESLNNNFVFPDVIELNQLKGENPVNFQFGETLLHPGDFVFSESGYGIFGIAPTPSTGHFVHAFGEREHGTVNTEVISSNSLFASGQVFNGFAQDIPPGGFSLPSGVFTFRATYEDYTVQGQPGKASVDFSVSPANSASVPVLSGLNLRVAGVSTDQLAPGDVALIDFDIKNNPLFGDDQKKQSNVYIRPTGDSVWTTLPVTFQSGASPSALIPPNLAAGFYSVKFSGTDITGTALNYVSEPAFRVGSVTNAKLPVPAAISPRANIVVSETPLLNWDDIGGALSYALQVSKKSDFSTVDLTLTSWLTTYQFFHPLDANTRYYWRVRAQYSTSDGPWSSATSFMTSTVTAPVALLPNYASQRTSNVVVFQWSNSTQSDGYRLQVSLFNDFSTVLADVLATETSTALPALPSKNPLYWRVKSSGTSIESDWSDVLAFDATFSPVTGIQSQNEDSFTVFPNPASSSVIIRFENPDEDPIRINVLNLLGQVVAVLNDESADATVHSVQWDLRAAGNNLKVADGVYLIQLTKGVQHYIKRVMVRR